MVEAGLAPGGRMALGKGRVTDMAEALLWGLVGLLGGLGGMGGMGVWLGIDDGWDKYRKDYCPDLEDVDD